MKKDDSALQFGSNSMTVGAYSSTHRVKSTPATAGPADSFPANDLRVFVDGLRRLGYRVDDVLAAGSLRQSDLTNPDGRVRCEAFGSVIASAQQQRFPPNLALQLALVTPIGSWPLLDYLVLTSDTVGDGVRQLSHYFRLVANPIVFTVHEEFEPIRIEIAAPSPFGIEFDAALLVLHFRSETDGRFAAASASFTHSLDDASAFERTLGCRVESNATWNGVSVSRESWSLPLRRRDAVLRQVLESQADEILARLPTRTGLTLDVQRVLRARVAGGDTRIAAVARQMALSPRTLQRRLAAEGVSYQQLLEDARKEAAGRYISGTMMAIGEVAYLVGYSDPAPFHRAFKRWYGTTPDVFRQRQRTAGRVDSTSH
jgi:AraC-like DNA-binding protein